VASPAAAFVPWWGARAAASAVCTVRPTPKRLPRARRRAAARFGVCHWHLRHRYLASASRHRIVVGERAAAAGSARRLFISEQRAPRPCQAAAFRLGAPAVRGNNRQDSVNN